MPEIARFMIQQTIGHYHLTAKLGEGGMGAVYRATDTRLNREVAIKILPEVFAKDPDRMSRFEREAQVLASLSHPNIATIYGIEQCAIVMELVEGADLRGPLPIETVIDYAREIASALEAAHEKGIVHRDLKPANIKVTPDGVVKLLDFGLAKTAGQPENGAMLTMGATQAGVILGTAAYMAPEQARGKPVDKRADIWAFGVVLFEMLTGKQLFGTGETLTDILAAVVTREPDWSALPERTPPHVLRLLERCLRKDPKLRLRDIGDARIALDEPERPAPSPNPTSSVTRHGWLPWAVAALSVVAGAAGWWRATPPAPAATYRLSMLPPEKGAFVLGSLPAVSPDGQRLAFAASVDGKTELWIRDLNNLSSRPLPGSEDAADPFWSPDGRSVAFFARGKLKKADLAGGPVAVLCDAIAGRGGSWNQNDVIIFAPGPQTDLFRVPASGGAPTALTQRDQMAGENSHRTPWFLPDGRHYVFAIDSTDAQRSGTYLGDLDSKATKRLLPDMAAAVYSPPGFLLVGRGQNLVAHPFDPTSLRINGEPAIAAEQVIRDGVSVKYHFGVSQTGILAFYGGGATPAPQLTWLDRAGKRLGTVGPRGIMLAPAISPDGKIAVVDRLNGPAGAFDIWLHDLAHGTDSRFTFDHPAQFPNWSPNGDAILYLSLVASQGGANQRSRIYRKPATGAGKEELLYESPTLTIPSGYSRDGQLAILTIQDPNTRSDVWILPLSGDRKPYPFLQTGADESFAKLSPDGHWLAYQSDESGSPEVYVQTFPGKEGKRQISVNGGTRPVWRRDGKELFYISAGQKMMAVDVTGQGSFEHGTPLALFDTHIAEFLQYDVDRDGKRFLMIGSQEPAVTQAMTVVVNWHAGLKK